jgi:glycosyltransferase involved in cell wall biosynthesis
MNITVILCTYNRSGRLAKALDSVAASELSKSVEWEILVVDNNSKDQTREVVESFDRQHPGRVRYLFEPKQGKSHALNAGIRQAHGDILAFIDDDMSVEPTWLRNLTAPLSDTKWAGTGGRIFPQTSFSAPNWLALDGPYSMLGVPYGHFDLGDKPCDLDRSPYGGNMAFPKWIFAKYGGFRTDLGPSPNNAIPLPNEDTEFGRRLLAAGERLRYEPTAVVYHEVLEQRITKQYFLTWWYGYGRAQVLEARARPDILGVPRSYLSVSHIALRHLPVRTLQWLFSTHPQSRFYHKCMVWVAVGWLTGMSQLAQQGKKVGQE